MLFIIGTDNLMVAYQYFQPQQVPMLYLCERSRRTLPVTDILQPTNVYHRVCILRYHFILRYLQNNLYSALELAVKVASVQSHGPTLKRLFRLFLHLPDHRDFVQGNFKNKTTFGAQFHHTRIIYRFMVSNLKIT